MPEMRRRIDVRRWLPCLLALVCCCAVGAAGRAATITVAAAADLRFAMDEIVAAFEAGSREDRVEVVFGSSGKLQTQIQQGAPYDLFFSADIEFPRRLAAAGLAASAVSPTLSAASCSGAPAWTRRR